MGKRGNGEGSISRRKDGLYMPRYTVRSTDGPKRRTIYGKKGESREDVAAKLTKAMADRDGGIIYDVGKLTVEDHLLGWLSDSVRDTVRQRIYERYESIVRVHLIPAIGRIKLKTLTPAHVHGLYRAKLDAGLASRSVLHIHLTLSKALKQATDDGLIPRNVAGLVKPPWPRREEIRPLDGEQVRTLFEAASASGDRLEVLYIVAVTTGMGRGELQGLKWEDLDLEAETLQVRRTLSEPKGGWIFEAPKSGKGRSKSASNDLWITCTLTSPFKYSTVARTVSPPGGWWTNRTSRTLSGSQWNLSHISRLSAVFILPYLLASVG